MERVPTEITPERMAEIASVASELGIPASVVSGFYKDDDWSFVMKIHALLEAGVQHLLDATFANERFYPVFAKKNPRLNLSKQLEYVDALSLLDSRAIEFIRGLSEIRNHLIHDIRNVEFAFGAFIKAMWAHYRKERPTPPIKNLDILRFMTTFGVYWPISNPLEGNANPNATGAGETFAKVFAMGTAQGSPKAVIFHGALCILAEIYNAKMQTKA